MHRGPYTLHDTPQVVDRIEADLAHVVDVVTRADPHLRSLVLTGGFARGEGATLDGAPQNDYDLVAVRSFGRPRRPYAHLKAELEKDLGLHIDLATIGTWRLPWVAPSIFWYEAALRGRVLSGRDMLSKIPIRDPHRIDPREGLRLLINRAAGLLLATERPDPPAWRIQAAKAFLAVLDARLLATGVFRPTHRERWADACAMRAEGTLSAYLGAPWPWFEWAYAFKTDPAGTPDRDAHQAWATAARAILDAVPHALGHARLASLEQYGAVSSLVERARYFWAARRIPGAPRLTSHPTGSVRVATIRLLAASLDGAVTPAAANAHLGALADLGDRPLRALDALRGATGQ